MRRQHGAAVAVALLLSSTATAAAAPQQAPQGPNCSLLTLTLALDFLVASKKTPDLAVAKQRDAWNALLRQADQAQKDFQAPAGALAQKYGALHAKLKAADAALRDHDGAQYSQALQDLKPALNTVSTLAKRAHLTCTIHSKGGTLTIGA